MPSIFSVRSSRLVLAPFPVLTMPLSLPNQSQVCVRESSRIAASPVVAPSSNSVKTFIKGNTEVLGRGQRVRQHVPDLAFLTFI